MSLVEDVTAVLCTGGRRYGRAQLTFVDIHHQDDHVYDLHAADDGADERGVPRAVDEGELKLAVRPVGGEQVFRHGYLSPGGVGGSQGYP